MRSQDEISRRARMCLVAGADPHRMAPMLTQLGTGQLRDLHAWARAAGYAAQLPTRRPRPYTPVGTAQLEAAACRAWRIAWQRLLDHSPLSGRALAATFEWLWLAGADDACEAMARAEWGAGGGPKLYAAGVIMRWRFPRRSTSGDYPRALRLAIGRTCRPDCDQGCALGPVTTPVDAAIHQLSSRPDTPGRAETPPADAGGATGRKGMTFTLRRPGRRAGTAALILALAAALVALAAAPALAGTVSSVQFVDDCEGTTVSIASGHVLPSYEWTVAVDGEQVWPGAGDTQPGPGETATVQIPRGARDIVVDFAGSPAGWPRTHSWEHPGGDACGLPAVEISGDCEQVQVVFSNPTPYSFSGDVRVDGEPGTADQWSEQTIGEGPHAGELFGDRYQVVDLPPGTAAATTTVAFPTGTGEHLVEAVIRRGAEQHWYHEWISITVDCGQPAPSPSSAPLNPVAQQLPNTGTSLVVLAVLAGLALLSAGGLLVRFVRRRRVHFTA